MTSSDLVRVSCVSLCRIRNKDGKFLLAYNANRMAQNIKVLMPLGGALECSDDQVRARFNAQPESPAHIRDLRWFIPLGSIEAFDRWFRTRHEREISPFRELQEELVHELKLIPALTMGDVEISYDSTHADQRITERSTVKGQQTYYWIEVFDVKPKGEGLVKALNALTDADNPRWVSHTEVSANQTHDQIAVDARPLLKG